MLRRVQGLSEEAAIRIAKEVLNRDDHYQLEETLDLLVSLPGSISVIPRRRIIDALDQVVGLEGRLHIDELRETLRWKQ